MKIPIPPLELLKRIQTSNSITKDERTLYQFSSKDLKERRESYALMWLRSHKVIEKISPGWYRVVIPNSDLHPDSSLSMYKEVYQQRKDHAKQKASRVSPASRVLSPKRESPSIIKTMLAKIRTGQRIVELLEEASKIYTEDLQIHPAIADAWIAFGKLMAKNAL